MQRGTEGTQLLWTTLTQSNGQSKRDGVLTKGVSAKYHWKKIPYTNFSLCLVVPLNDSNLVLHEDNMEHDDIFIHHRLDLNPDGLPMCRHIGRYSTKAGVTVKFTPDAFNDPQDFLYTPEDRDAVVEYTNYLEGDNDLRFKEGVRAAVTLTKYVERNWKKRSPYIDNIVWRYVGLEVGAFIKYPGTPMDPKYNPHKRPWYRKATAHPGDVILTTPYWDASGAGIVTTVAKTIVQGKNGGHQKGDRMIGVMGLDFNLDTIKLMIHREFTQCLEKEYSCFLVDTSGYIVYHDDFVKEGASRVDMEFVHLADKEEFITQFLLKGNHLFKQTCDDFEPKKNYHTYKLNIVGGVIRNMDSSDPPNFDAQRVPDANIYAFIKSTVPIISENRCVCPSVPSNITKCQTKDECECPCFTPASFQYCKNSYDTVQDSPPVCVPDTSQTTFESPVPNEDQLASTLDECFIVNCSMKIDTGSCNAVPACTWCSSSVLEGCLPALECPSPSTTSPDQDDSEAVLSGPAGSLAVIAGASAGGVVLVILIVVITVVVVRSRRNEPAGGHQIHDFRTDTTSSYDGISHVNYNSDTMAVTDGPPPLPHQRIDHDEYLTTGPYTHLSNY